MTQNNMPQFDGTIKFEHIMQIGEMNLNYMKVALEIKDYEAAEMYRHLANVYHNIANVMMEAALLPISDILQLPAIRTRAISLNVATINQQIGESTAFIELQTGDPAHKEKIQAKIQGPEERSKVQQFKEGIQRVVEIAKIHDVDLFALSKKKEKEIKGKLNNGEELTQEEEKLAYAKDIKDTIVEMIRNGGRMEAVDLIQNYAFKYANYSNSEANMLVQAIKEHYNVKEPKDKPTIEFTKVQDLPEDTWLKIEYLIKEKTADKDARIGLAFAALNKELGMMSPYSKKICSPEKILHYRPVFKYEEQRINKILKDI
jgi:hypothetical protein